MYVAVTSQKSPLPIPRVSLTAAAAVGLTLGLLPASLAQTAAPGGAAPQPAAVTPAAKPATAAPQAPPSEAGTVPEDPNSKAPKKPRKFLIDGKFRELKKGEIRPYTPPTLLPEPEPAPSPIKVFEVSARDEEPEAQVLARPYYGAPMVGTVVPGTRMAVRGENIAKTTRYCPSKRWLAVQPFGWVCWDHGKASDGPPTAEQLLRPVPGERVPFKYVMVSAAEPIPMWTNLEALKTAAEPERMLEKGDSIAIDKVVKYDGQSYYQSVESKILPIKGTYTMSATSDWHGILIDEKMHLPFGWILPDTVKLQESADKPTAVGTIKRRTRVDILDEQMVGNKRFVKIRLAAAPTQTFPLATAPLPPPPPAALTPAAAAKPPKPAPVETPAIQLLPAKPAPATTAAPGPAPAAAPAANPAEATYWVPAYAVNEVRLRPRPEGTGENTQWLDADLAEQVLVGYQGDKPAFATLVSSGKNNATPLGNYPVWARVGAISMKSQPYDDKGYFVNMVPWSTFFQAHNAIHGAYWHDRFGGVKSHGCINVAPLDARFVFEWLKPELPPGWTSVRPVELTKWPTIHVHDVTRKPGFKQERPIGPTDRRDEEDRVEEAEKRRALLPPGTPGAPGAPGTPGSTAAPSQIAPSTTVPPGAMLKTDPPATPTAPKSPTVPSTQATPAAPRIYPQT
jgi:lipoprotein-anchoring transpeptidase ErfK/SrfK